MKDRTVSIRMIEGELAIEKLVFEDAQEPLEWKVIARPGAPAAKEI
jgi:hypothetical protein